MKSLNEPYIKENNILQLSLFYFGKGRPEKTVITWKGPEGKYKLQCVCCLGVPGSFDQDVYTACMRIWVKQGMPDGGIRLNYSDIARELNLLPRDWNVKIKESLEKLGQARYRFNQCFIKADKDGNRKLDTHFSLFSTVDLFKYEKGKSKRKSETLLYFPEKIRENLEAKYYQWLDMAWYRALPEGLPRRLYEYLEKRRYHNVNGAFSISEEAICRWLPLTDKHATNRRKRLAAIAQTLIDKGYLKSYSFDGKRKICTYTYARQAPPVEALQGETIPEVPALSEGKVQEKRAIESARGGPGTTPPPEEKTASENRADLLAVLNWLDTIPYFHKDRKNEIAMLPEVCSLFPGIRQEYERLAAMHKRPKAGWVYKAFKEGYRFSDNDQESYQTAEQTKRNAEREAKIA
ncbi:MAG: hypothetical protein AB1798_17490, partial [Spirochaetota bacterium]